MYVRFWDLFFPDKIVAAQNVCLPWFHKRIPIFVQKPFFSVHARILLDIVMRSCGFERKCVQIHRQRNVVAILNLNKILFLTVILNIYGKKWNMVLLAVRHLTVRTLFIQGQDCVGWSVGGETEFILWGPRVSESGERLDTQFSPLSLSLLHVLYISHSVTFLCGFK